jgi:2-haloalkanoic acid dehalogenase type II
MTRGKPYLFFDLGETLVELDSLILSLAEILKAAFPGVTRPANEIAREWAFQAASRLPSAQGPNFATEHSIGAGVLQGLLRAAGADVPLKEAAELLIKTRDRFIERVRLYPDADGGWLGAIRARAAGMGIVTDGDAQYVPRILDRLRIRGFFDTITTSESVKAYKPDVRIYRSAMESAGAEPEKSLFVSDSTLDLQGAAAVGMGTAHVARRLLPGRPTFPDGCVRLTTLRDLDAVLSRYGLTGRFTG